MKTDLAHLLMWYQKVNAYGFMTLDYRRYSDHYYDRRFHPVLFYANHDLRMELRLWQQLHEAGLIKLYMRTWMWWALLDPKEMQHIWSLAGTKPYDVYVLWIWPASDKWCWWKGQSFFFFYCLLNLFRNWDSVAVAVALTDCSFWYVSRRCLNAKWKWQVLA